MKTDTMIKSEGLDILFNNLGDVDAERFIVLLSKEKYDYTNWQRNLWKDKSVKEVIKIAQDLERKFLNDNQ